MRVLDDARPCAGCRGPRGPICPVCRPAFQGPAVPVDRGDALPLPVMASAVYEGPVREALVAFKDHGRWSLGPVLGACLASSVRLLVRARSRQLLRALGDDVEDDSGVPRLEGFAAPVAAERFLLVPVPSSPRSVRERDGQHVAELADRAEQLARPLRVESFAGLAVVRRRRDQVGLRRTERAANLRGTLGATDRLLVRACRPGTAVILVDDLLTTGATLAEAHRALVAAGIRPWGAAVVAATPDLVRRPLPGTRLPVR